MIKFNGEKKKNEVLNSILFNDWDAYDFIKVFYKESEKITLNIKNVVFTKNTTLGEVQDFFNNNEGFFINISFYC